MVWKDGQSPFDKLLAAFGFGDMEAMGGIEEGNVMKPNLVL